MQEKRFYNQYTKKSIDMNVINPHVQKDPSEIYVRKGSFLENIDLFDNDKFRISVQEAKHMDPQQRIVLETVLEALGDRPYVKRTGIYVGCNSYDWQTLIGNTASISSPYTGTGASNSIISNRISYTFGFDGPSLTVDTACSSSLVALDLAMNALLHGQCDEAIVVGVQLNILVDTYRPLCAANMLSPGGRCATFSSDADGYVRGEGCGVLVLTSLSNAQRDEENALAVIRGTAVSQDGTSANLTSPNGISQEHCIRTAIKRADVNPSEIKYIETHGTGTPLGDPIEVSALFNALEAPSNVVLGAVKTNVGHLEGAAGMAGIFESHTLSSE